MDEKEIKVTGTRDFGNGVVRDPNTSKGRYDLLSPLFLRRLAVHTQKGGQARGDRNWEGGMPMAATLDSTIRHLYQYLEGDRSEDHLGAASWGLQNLVHTEEQIERGNLPASLAEGLPDYTGQTITSITLNKDDELEFTNVPVEQTLEVYDTDKPHEHYDDPRYFVKHEKHCGNCFHPFSERCSLCRRCSNWKAKLNQ